MLTFCGGIKSFVRGCSNLTQSIQRKQFHKKKKKLIPQNKKAKLHIAEKHIAYYEI